MGTGFREVDALCKNSRVLEGFSTRGGLEREGEYLVLKGAKAKEAEAEVIKWLRKIKML